MVRSGIGFDVHQLKNGFDLYVGGIKIKSDLGSLGHSDGDALIHAIVDALLGAACLGDIGKYFPSNQKKWKGVESELFLFEILGEICGFFFQEIQSNFFLALA